MENNDLLVYQHLYKLKNQKGRLTKEDAAFAKKHAQTKMPLALCVYGFYLVNKARNEDDEIVGLTYLKDAYRTGDVNIKASVFKFIDDRFGTIRRDLFMNSLN